MNGLLPKRFHPLLDGLYSTMTAAAALRTFLCRENPPNIQQHHRPTPSSCFFFKNKSEKQNEKDNKFKVSPNIQQHHCPTPSSWFFQKQFGKQNEKEKKIKVSPSFRSHHRPIPHMQEGSFEEKIGRQN